MEFPYAHSTDRSFKEMRGSCAFCLKPRVAPVNEIQTEPRYVMTALIGGTQTKGFTRGKMRHASSLSRIVESQVV